ncbi:pyridoxal phosphate-dependent aminotransferase [Carnobacterium funditum]|uniref:pyridoxal phosphate-dependent aminotransferase n=1 Tax=Carnobacterium funditum TaxID=2752 RepID=UPI0005568AC2|nr:pyridoxal phosphate-dependent aminotransferase [Carnobacterium funditum]
MNKRKNLLNQQLSLLQSSSILKFDAEVSLIPGMTKLTLGEPDFNTPEHIKLAGMNAIEENHTHYAPTAGELPLRQAAAIFLKEKYDLDYKPDSEILVTAGATEAIYVALFGLLNPGEKVLIPTPIYPGYIPVTILSRCTPIFIDTSSNHFVLSPEMIQEAILEHGESIKAIVLNYPNNPTGVTYTRDEVVNLANELKKHDLFVLSDEIYSELTYSGSHVSIAKYLPEQTLLINGVSKSHAMTGWRIGLLCGPAEIIQEINKVHQFLITSTATMSQKAALAAFTDGINDAQLMKNEYLKRRDYVYERIQKIGFTCPKPNGAFYLFAKIPEGYIQDSMSFCVDLAQKNKVALIPGDSFGPGGEGYVRISYAASMKTLITAMEKLTNYIENNKKTDIV